MVVIWYFGLYLFELWYYIIVCVFLFKIIYLEVIFFLLREKN